jgi:MarR family transcriptional regulator, organic hydroperoxide resistance regulator
MYGYSFFAVTRETRPAGATEVAAPGDAAAEFEEAFGEFIRAARRARGRASQAPAKGLSLAQYHVLEPLLDGPLTTGQAAVAAGVASPTATRVLDGLVERGYVERTGDPADRRAVLVSLTAPGRRATLAKRREISEVRGRIAEVFDEDEQRQAADLLRRMAEVIEHL